MNGINMQLTEKMDGAEETERQFMYIEKAKGYVKALAEELGRTPTCCVTTFGCQMNPTSEIRKTA